MKFFTIVFILLTLSACYSEGNYIGGSRGIITPPIPATAPCENINPSPDGQINPAVMKINDVTTNVVFVNLKGCGSGTGNSWADATSIQFLINANKAIAGKKVDKVFIQAGLYKPTDISDNTTAIFTFPSAKVATDTTYGVEYVGGFKGDSSDMASSDPTLYPTIFCGRINGTSKDCSDGISSSSLLNSTDAAQISNISFIGAYSASNGGAIKAQRLVARNIIARDNRSNNQGGAIAAFTSPFRMENSILENNISAAQGGAVALGFYGGNGTIKNSSFNNNVSNFVSTQGGGAFYANGYKLAFINSSFYANNAQSKGIALYNSGSTVLINSTFSGHPYKTNAEVIYSPNGAYINSIIYDASVDVHSANINGYNDIVKGGIKSAVDATRNVRNIDPQLDPLTYSIKKDRAISYRPLQATSPAMNSGIKVWVDDVISKLYFMLSDGTFYVITCTPTCQSFATATSGDQIDMTKWHEYSAYDAFDIGHSTAAPDLGPVKFR